MNTAKLNSVGLIALCLAALTACGGGGGGSGLSPSTNMVGITVDDATVPTKLYVSDFGLSVVKSVDIATGVSTILAGKSGSPGATNNAIGTLASFYGVEGLSLFGTNLYAVDAFNCGIRNISTTPPYAVTTLAGSLGVACGNADTAAGVTPTFNIPRNVAQDRVTGDIYVAEDSVNNSIRKITPAGVVTTIVTGLVSPWGITSDNASPPVLYITNQTGNSIKKVAFVAGAWSVSTFAGSVAGTAGLANGNGTAATFSSPLGITIDDTFTNLYVVDNANNSIRKITIAAPQTVTTIAGTNPVAAGAADNATGTLATFNTPTSIAYGGGNLYVTDQGGKAIRVISTTAPNAVTTKTLN